MSKKKKEEIVPFIPPVKEVKKRKRKSKTEAWYVSPKEFLEDLKEYYRTDIITDSLADKINRIIEGLGYAPNFINYSYKEEMKGDARLKMVAALMHKKFDISKGSSCFGYYTTIAWHAFINRIKKEKKQHETIENYKEQTYSNLLNSGEGNTGNIYTDPGNHGLDNED